MKHLPKHVRPRWRYLAVAIEAWPDTSIARRVFQREVWYAAQNLLGDAGSADVDLTVVSFDYSDGAGRAIVRTRRTEADRARGALACVDSVDDAAVGLRVLGISGTVRACEEKYIRGPTERPAKRQVVFENQDRRAVERGERIDVRTDDTFAGATALDFR